MVKGEVMKKLILLILVVLGVFSFVFGQTENDEGTLVIELVDSNTEFVNWGDQFGNANLAYLPNVMEVELTNTHDYEIRLDMLMFSLWYYDEFEIDYLHVYMNGQPWISFNDDPEGYNYMYLDYLLQPGESVIVSTDIGVWGNGRGSILIDGINYSRPGDDNFNVYFDPEYTDSHVSFMVVNPGEGMYQFSRTVELDTLYIFPTQHYRIDYHVWGKDYNSFDDRIVGMTVESNGYHIGGQSYLFSWTEETLQDLGTFTYLYEYPFVEYVWNSDTDIGISSSHLFHASLNNDEEEYSDGYWYASVNIHTYHPGYGYWTEYHFDDKTVIYNQGTKGDITGDDQTDWTDYAVLIQELGFWNLEDTQFNPYGETNIARSNLIFSWTTLFHAWLLNIWLENPDNYMVANLCIGQEFDYNGCQGIEDRSVEYVIDDNSIELSTDGNIVGVLGTLPDGERWSTVVQLSDDGLLFWSDDNQSIEPVVLENQITRDGVITLNLPVGLVIERVEAKQLNQYLPGDLNDDGGLDVVDIVQLVDDIFNDNYSAVGDLNNDGFLNVTDVVLLVDSILNIGLERSIPIEVSISVDSNYMSLTSDGSIAGIQLTTSGDFQIDQTSIPAGWQLFQQNGQVMMISMDGSGLSGDNLFTYSGELVVDEILVADWQGNSIPVTMTTPQEYSLSPAYPNPFNPVTTLSYSVPEDSNLRITVYDMLGREVTELVSGFQTAGNYNISWNASNKASGVYLVKMTTSTYKSTQKVLLVK